MVGVAVAGWKLIWIYKSQKQLLIWVLVLKLLIISQAPRYVV